MDALTTVTPTTDLQTAGINAHELLAAFFSGKSERTIEAYRRDLDAFRRFMGAETIDDAARAFLRDHPRANLTALDYLRDMQGRGLSPATVNRRLAALRSLVALARTLGIVSWRLDVRNVKSEAYRDTSGPGTIAVKAMMAATSGRGDAKGLRDTTIIRLLHDLALRRGEVVGLNVSDLDLPTRTVWVRGKGRTEKTKLTLPEATAAAIGAWLRERGDADGPLFTNLDRARQGSGRLTGTAVYKIVSKLGAAMGVTTRPHRLRHTAITTAVERAQAAGIGLDEVTQFSRHRDVRTLMVYRDRTRNVQGAIAEIVAAG